MLGRWIGIGLACLVGTALGQPVRRGVDMEAATGASFRTPHGFDQMRDASAGMRAFQAQRRMAVPRVAHPVPPGRRR